MKPIRRMIAIATVLCLLSVNAVAAPNSADSSLSTTGPRRHIQNIIFAGLAGAVLGLSTLSFYGRPQDRLSNIAVGFAIGVISGTAYSTYKAAAEPKDFYNWQEAHPETWALFDNPRGNENAAFTPRSAFIFEF